MVGRASSNTRPKLPCFHLVASSDLDATLSSSACVLQTIVDQRHLTSRSFHGFPCPPVFRHHRALVSKSSVDANSRVFVRHHDGTCRASSLLRQEARAGCHVSHVQSRTRRPTVNIGLQVHILHCSSGWMASRSSSMVRYLRAMARATHFFGLSMTMCRNSGGT